MVTWRVSKSMCLGRCLAQVLREGVSQLDISFGLHRFLWILGIWYSEVVLIPQDVWAFSMIFVALLVPHNLSNCAHCEGCCTFTYCDVTVDLFERNSPQQHDRRNKQFLRLHGFALMRQSPRSSQSEQFVLTTMWLDAPKGFPCGISIGALCHVLLWIMECACFDHCLVFGSKH